MDEEIEVDKIPSTPTVSSPMPQFTSEEAGVEEIEEDLLPEVENRVENEFNFKILDHRLTFHGVCSECQAKNKQ